jgi:glutaminyl-tRNA synthetase
MENNTETPAVRTNFIHELIDKDNASGRFQGRVHTRFPPGVPTTKSKPPNQYN